MKNIKKIGLSALAGALAMTSAHAGALSVTGNMEITYTTGSKTDNGNPLGQANDLTISGSTELDNGVTVSYKNTTSDTTLTGDSELAFGNVLGGTLAMTSAGAPISGIDNKTPTAFVDAEGQAGSITDVNGSDGTYGIRYTLADVAGSGFKLDYMYFPKHGTGDATGDQAYSGGAPGNRDAHDITLTGSVPGIEGLNIGAGYYTADYDLTGGSAATNNDTHEGTAYATYAYGPLTLGYQLGAVTEQGAGNAFYKNKYFGVSYAVSDDLSVSYNRTESRKGNVGYIAGDSTYDGISLSYSVGGMTINMADTDCSNCSYTAAKSQGERTVSLSVAF